MNWYCNRLVSDFIELSPQLYFAVQNQRLGRVAKTANRLVRPESELVIEGFPRCANSFAVKAFRAANDPEEQMHIGTHAHSPANIIMAIRWQVPTLVLVREPEDAVLSYVARILEFDEVAGLNKDDPVNDPTVNRLISYWTKRFSLFYDRLRPYVGCYVSADFRTVTKDFSEVIARLNRKYGKSYQVYDSTKANNKAIFESSGGHLSPSVRRDRFRDSLRAVYHEKKNTSHRERADVAYERFCRFHGE